MTYVRTSPNFVHTTTASSVCVMLGAGPKGAASPLYRLLLLTFFLQFFPDLVTAGHVFIIETPLFRVRNKKETIYCYSDEERQNAIAKIGSKAEITRFKGLGEISPDEFGGFIGDDIRLQPVLLGEGHLAKVLEFYMGKNTPVRQDFIIENLRIELDKVDKQEEIVEEVE